MLPLRLGDVVLAMLDGDVLHSMDEPREVTDAMITVPLLHR